MLMATDMSSAMVPVAMHVPRTTLGVERKLFHVNIGLGVLLFSIFKTWWIFPAPLIGHFVGLFITLRYPALVDIYLKYRRQGDYYRPWGEPRVCNRRPEGYGRDLEL
jgi:hypothetical protein